MAEKERDEEDETTRRDEEDEEDEKLASRSAREAKAHEPEGEEHDEGEAHDKHEAHDEPEEREEEKPRERERNRELAETSPARRRPKGGNARLAKRRQPPKGSMTKSLVLFVLILGGIVVAAAVLGKEEPNANGPVPAPKWNNGQTVEVEITVVPSDAKDLACSASTPMNGRKCQFETPSKAFDPPVTEDKSMLKPYTTTDRIQFLAAGLWSDPALAPGKLPNTRFSVKCKYTVDGKMKGVGVRWNTDGPWFPQTEEWYAGAVSGCTLLPP